MIAKHILEKYYNKKLNLNKNKGKDAKFYNILYSEGLRRIGINNYNGIGIIQNYEKAFNYFQKAAKRGNRIAQCNLGVCYIYRNGIEKNKLKAFEFFKKSAEQGYKDAQFWLGYYYDKEYGIKFNKEKAFEFY
ncbi:4633_t:CDS:1 [Funneliformis geosporum]|nr:4633_t:CDS:1 [Funneliformis geosporum]